ncbi:MAG TPA: hypothetical protein VK446_07115 [Methylocystis sp.]|nr:hypothetical protein [Methylocystis sp.]
MNELQAIESTYTQLATDLDRKLDDARQRGSQSAIDWAEKQQLINDSAYFILVWGQLEAKINGVCEKAIRKHRKSVSWRARRAWDAHDPDNIRAKFEDRAALVLDRFNTQSDAYRKTIRYYNQRNQVAHGKSLATGINVPFVITEIYQIISELRD